MKETKTVLITGISKGIGKAIAIDLQQKGYRVFGTCRNPDELKEKIEGVTYLKLDLKNADEIQSCFEAVPDSDILINNAGQSQMGPAEQISLEKVRHLFEINFFGTIALTQKFAARMRERRSGLIINIGTLSGTFGMPFQSTYGSSKIALRAWSTCLRKEMMQYGVKICMIEPFYINSGIELDLICDAKSVYKKTTDRVFARRNENLAKADSPYPLVETVNKIIGSPNPKGMYISEPKGRFLYFISRFLSQRTIERKTCKGVGL